ncbi:E3 ubiquitin-protein ligase TRIM39-like [Megalobrama amblycephala]|uniref:E3 ubiquitin-protein ligase TRIM39-like n=1 Tax=Megalobrama amblycephala TaxID=75352 RepID=UPI0020143259|nr:E3 ubiquitin-protein ligase TRIM39-like [Megalobrama amblycephala]
MMEEQQKAAEKQAEDLNKELKMMEEQQKAAEKQAEDLNKELKMMEEQQKAAKKEAEDLNKELKMMEEQQKAAKKEAEDLNKELKMMEEQQKAAEKEAEDLIKELKMMEEQQKAAEKEAEDLNKELKMMEEQQKAAKKEAEDLNKELKMMEEQQKAAKKEAEDLNKELKMMEEQQKAAKKEAEDLNKELKMMEEQQKAAKKEAEDLNKELKMMKEQQKAAEKQAEDLIKELKQEITELEQLTQMFSSLYSISHTKISDVDEKSLKRALNLLKEQLNEKLIQTELKFVQKFAVDVTLDPDTAHPRLILSDDGKQVSDGDMKRNVPENPKRFDYSPCVLAKEGFSSGRFYYEVQVKGKTQWSLGVARESINRKKHTWRSPDKGVWAVTHWNYKYVAHDSKFVSLSLSVKPEKVRVFVDYEEGLVSFSDVDSRSHIYSFTGLTFTDKLYPYFCPGYNEEGKNSKPLIITPVN